MIPFRIIAKAVEAWGSEVQKCNWGSTENLDVDHSRRGSFMRRGAVPARFAGEGFRNFGRNWWDGKGKKVFASCLSSGHSRRRIKGYGGFLGDPERRNGGRNGGVAEARQEEALEVSAGFVTSACEHLRLREHERLHCALANTHTH